MRHLPIVLLAGIAATPLPAQDDGFVWRDDLDAARALAAELGKPMLVLFRCEP